METYPLASICLVAYNQEKYIKEAVLSVLNQDYPNLEIILSDDCSSDKTFDIMTETVKLYKGPHKIILNRNENNLGPREHVNKLLYKMSQGEFIFLAAGDDISAQTRVSECVGYMVNHQEVSSMSCRSQEIDTESKPINTENQLLTPNSVSVFSLEDYVNLDFYIFSGDSRVLRRSVIEAFPPLKYPFAEDIYLFVRSLYVGSIAYIRKPLVFYRIHSDSIMGKSSQRIGINKKTRERYKNACRQINEDFELALANGYIPKEAEEIVWKKMDKLLLFLKPRNRYLYVRAPRVLCRYLSKIFKQLENSL